MKILLAMDSTGSSQAAFAAVMDRYWPAGSAVEIISVVPPHGDRKEALAAATELLDNTATQLRAKFADDLITWRVRLGDPVQEIVALARQNQSDVIVMGSHNKDAMTRFFLGSVAQGVLDKAPCSVFVARNLTQLERILIVVDNSEDYHAVMESIANSEWTANAEFQLLAVQQPPDELSSFEQNPAHVLEVMRQHEQSVSLLKSRLAGATTRLCRRFGIYRVHSTLIEGDPVEIIPHLAQAWKSDLIVIGSDREKGCPQCISAKSYASVAHGAPCSVQIVKSPPSDGEPADVVELKPKRKRRSQGT